ncbi:hypothetical protein KM043_016130 [Ampulex compressa]|nr:hypothetical protein KM043_016130 [Ampulex compressa]
MVIFTRLQAEEAIRPYFPSKCLNLMFAIASCGGNRFGPLAVARRARSAFPKEARREEPGGGGGRETADEERELEEERNWIVRELFLARGDEKKTEGTFESLKAEAERCPAVRVPVIFSHRGVEGAINPLAYWRGPTDGNWHEKVAEGCGPGGMVEVTIATVENQMDPHAAEACLECAEGEEGKKEEERTNFTTTADITILPAAVQPNAPPPPPPHDPHGDAQPTELC